MTELLITIAFYSAGPIGAALAYIVKDYLHRKDRKDVLEILKDIPVPNSEILDSHIAGKGFTKLYNAFKNELKD